MHHIQHYILIKLSTTKWARFSEMRPPKVDSNAYSYHLTLLQKQQLVEKHVEKGYRLSPKGLAHVDRMSSSELHVRIQPKIISMCLLYDEQDNVALLAKSKQPFISAWVFPHGKMHIEDGSARSAMVREINERVAISENDTLRHAADVYIHASINGQLVSSILAHVFTMRVTRSDIERQDIKWTTKHDWADLQLAPGVQEIYELIEANKGSFAYAEYSIDW
ncbi:MAG: Hydrolase [Candidatus Saccharibacteria bacterium]|nr:Hydrolase [Candidatus Saccharibacteria bacterium]